MITLQSLGHLIQLHLTCPANSFLLLIPCLQNHSMKTREEKELLLGSAMCMILQRGTVKRWSTAYGFEEGEIVSLDGGAFVNYAPISYNGLDLTPAPLKSLLNRFDANLKQSVDSGGQIQLAHATLMEILDKHLLIKACSSNCCKANNDAGGQ